MDILKDCTLCPRNCHINRYEKVGFCGASDKIKIAHYDLYYGEEPIISGKEGSGAIFFSHCNLKCIFCQNKKISLENYGKEISEEKLYQIMLKLQSMGANNINLVTPTHYVPQIAKSIKKAKDKGLKIPIVYNTGSYENIETIQLMNNLVDIYLADLKYFNNNLGIKYSSCKNYFEYATGAINEMYKQVGKYKIVNDLMMKGLIVRVLVLPGEIEDAKMIIKYLYDTYKDNIIISIMNQYTPMDNNYEYNNLNRCVTEDEYNEVVNYAYDIGVRSAFIQEGITQSKSFIPNFNCDNI